MFKFIKQNLETIAGIEIYPLVSLIIFFTFFVGLFFWVFSYKKEKIDELSQLPFKDEQ